MTEYARNFRARSSTTSKQLRNEAENTLRMIIAIRTKSRYNHTRCAIQTTRWVQFRFVSIRFALGALELGHNGFSILLDMVSDESTLAFSSLANFHLYLSSNRCAASICNFRNTVVMFVPLSISCIFIEIQFLYDMLTTKTLPLSICAYAGYLLNCHNILGSRIFEICVNIRQR